MEDRYTEDVTDQSLMLAVGEGDVEKLGILFERYHGPLFNYLFRLCGNKHLSEDLVQEVFVRILKYRHTYGGNHRFTTWMFQIARNARIDHYRQNPVVDASLECQVQEFLSDSPTPDQYMEQEEEMRIMLAALEKLPEERREVLLLRGFQGLKFEEIAEVLRCSVNTIKGRAFRGIRELRDAVHQLKREKLA
jgi:RNA polymerase sigma factor (sigma-70 family)